VRGAIQRAAFLSGLLPSHSEAAQVVRYLPSQQYRPHFDWFDPAGGESYRRKTAAGGQRAVTCLVYLAEPERGGRTSFPKLGFGFEPRVGEAVLWWNIKEDGKEDAGTLHAGDPVLAGEKWALNIWLRQHPRRQSGGGGGGGSESKNSDGGGDIDEEEEEVDDEGEEGGEGGSSESADGLVDGVATLSVSR
jgi:prolyl 4-hydroxylase